MSDIHAAIRRRYEYDPKYSMAQNRLRRVASHAMLNQLNKGVYGKAAADDIRQYMLGHYRVVTIPDHYVSDVTRWIEERFL